MGHTMEDIPELDRAGLRKFGLTTGAIIAVLFGVIFPWLLDAGIILWPWILFAVLAALGLIAPMSLRPVYHGWMRFGLLMSRFTTPLIMGLVFFVAITPVALIMKILGKDAMKRQLKKDETTYRVVSNKTARETIERPY